MRIYLTIFVIALAVHLLSEEYIEEIHSLPSMDGCICYNPYSQLYEVVGHNMYIGDINYVNYPQDPVQNCEARGYMTFELPMIQSDFVVDSAYVVIYQNIAVGYDSWYQTEVEYPVWDIPNGSNNRCLLNHINYGDELDTSDWDKGDEDNAYTLHYEGGVLPITLGSGYRYADITECIVSDYEQNRNETQFRISFEVNNDWDNHSDYILLSVAASHEPKLFIKYTDEVSIEEHQDEFITGIITRIFPNPFSATFSTRGETGINIKINFPQPSNNAVLNIYNIKGEKVKSIHLEENKKECSVKWNGRNDSNDLLSSGLYLYRITSDTDHSETKKMIIIK